MTQLALFDAAPARPLPPPIDPVLGSAPLRMSRSDPYLPFDGAAAREQILRLCNASTDWVSSHDISRKVKMYPADLSRLCTRMVDRGELEETKLFYGGDFTAKPEDYRGFQYGYRLPQEGK